MKKEIDPQHQTYPLNGGSYEKAHNGNDSNVGDRSIHRGDGTRSSRRRNIIEKPRV
jgi:hypothetical protein